MALIHRMITGMIKRAPYPLVIALFLPCSGDASETVHTSPSPDFTQVGELRLVIRWGGDDFASKQDIELKSKLETLIEEREVAFPGSRVIVMSARPGRTKAEIAVDLPHPRSYKIKTTPEEILFNMGTNKIHLYQFLIARQMGKKIDIEDFEKIKDSETYEPAKRVFDRYQEIMLEHYRTQCKPIPGAEDTFRWCHDHGIKVATDTGFHLLITDAIMDSLGWVKRGLVDLSVDVEHIPGEIGRPAPFMLFYAMTHFNVQSVHEVIKVGDTPADMLEGRNAGSAAWSACSAGRDR